MKKWCPPEQNTIEMVDLEKIIYWISSSYHDKETSYVEVKNDVRLSKTPLKRSIQRKTIFFCIQWSNQKGEFAPHCSRSPRQNFYTSMRGVEVLRAKKHIQSILMEYTTKW